jgi:hypothetical protein
MFVSIDTKGANHIVIHIPHEGADKSLPAIARMLEQNAVFIQKGWSSAALVKPEMSIVLGDKFEVEKDGDEPIVVKESTAVLPDDFVAATPDVFVSNAKAAKKAAEDSQRLRTEVSHLKDQIESLKAQLQVLAEAE